LWTALQRLRDEGVFRKIGISVYAAEEPARLAARFRPDVMQLPFSLLDQRLLADGTLARLAELNVEVHARSLFLQGLLFLETLPEKLRHAAPRLTNIRSQLRDAGMTPLAAALGFVLSRPEVRFGLVGVTSAQELDEITTATQKALPPNLDWAAFALHDEMTLTPSLW
jgi:aryl-alcohol dehydrogenase-like predicted oxidoreductase